MRFKIMRSIPARNLTARLPRYFRKYLPARTVLEGTFTLLVFKDEVVLSTTVKKAFEQLGDASEQQILAVGREFTLEAADLLRTSRVPNLAPAGFWTDESYKSITQGWHVDELRDRRGRTN